jgi:uncharacterized membrane protein YkvA (DUF1232 family)
VLAAAAASLAGRRDGALQGLRDDAGALLRMIREASSGHYRRLPKRSLIAALAAVLYFLDPFDLIPDVVPLFGMLDDAVVFMWALRQVRGDLDAFLEWERDFGGAVDVEPRDVVPPTEALPS